MGRRVKLGLVIVIGLGVVMAREMRLRIALWVPVWKASQRLSRSRRLWARGVGRWLTARAVYRLDRWLGR